MPMYHNRVPQAVRPWIYVIFAIIFQLTGTIYLGALSQEMGTLSLMREDVMMIGMMGVIGVNMPFPFLFNFKLRYPNKTLLINAATIILVCNILSVYVTDVPLLCALSYIAGFMKLCGTFECFSNIRLWISPKQDFGVFLPTIYIVILGAQSLSTWLTVEVSYYCDGWQAMNWVMSALLMVMILLIFVLTRNKMFLPQRSIKSLDWLGCLLWSTVMAEVIFLFLYGEYYNWTDSKLWCSVAIATPLTLIVCVMRMNRIRHPYIIPGAWKHKRLVPILALFAIAEVMNATPGVLQSTFTGAILHWGDITLNVLNIWELAGSALGCLLTIWWGVAARWRYTQLLTLAFAFMLYYQVFMYFNVSPDMNIERLYIPLLLKSAGYAVFFSTMTIYLKWLIAFPTFFMALTMSGFIRNGVMGSISSGIYSFSLRYHIADGLVRLDPQDITSIVMSSVKQSYGWVCWLGIIVLFAMLLYQVNSVREIVKRVSLPLPRFERLYKFLS